MSNLDFLKNMPSISPCREGFLEGDGRDLPTEAYIIAINRGYLDLSESMIRSLYCFSYRAVIVYCINFDLPDNYSPYPNAIYRKLNIDEGADILGDDSIFRISHCKALACMMAIEGGVERGVFIDTDAVAKENIDSIFEYTYQYSGSRLKNNRYPLFSRMYYDVISVNGNSEPSKNLMDYLGIKEKTVELITSCVFTFTKDCYSFFSDWWNICFDKNIIVDRIKYFPLGDETSANVLLWKYKATRCLPISFLNVFDINTVLEFEKSSETGKDLETRLNHIPNQKETVKFFHLPKERHILDEILDHLIKKEYLNMSKKIMKLHGQIKV